MRLSRSTTGKPLNKNDRRSGNNKTQNISGLIRITKKVSKAIVSTGQCVTDSIKVNRGIRKGDSLSAIFFITPPDCIIREVECDGLISNRTDIATVQKRRSRERVAEHK